MRLNHQLLSVLFLIFLQFAFFAIEVESCFAQEGSAVTAGASGVSESFFKLQNFNLFVGPSNVLTRTTGSGFTASQPAALGSTFGSSLQVKATPLSLTFVAQYNLTQANQEVASGLSPSKISLKKEEFSLHGLNEAVFKDKWYSFKIGVGYKLQKYEADQTKPNVAVTTQTTQGLYFALNKSLQIQENAVAEFDFKLHLPNRVHEEATSTGTNPSFLGTEFQFTWHKSFRPNWSYTLGAKIQYEQASYTGVGARGTNSADDIRSNFNLPIGLEYNF